MAEEKNPVDQVLDLFVFAPLGLAITARTQLPEMMAKGRAQVEGQINMARFIGQFAVQQGKVEVEKRIKAYTSPVPTPTPTPAPKPEPAPSDPPPVEPEPEAPATVALPLTLRAEPAPDIAEPAPEIAEPAPEIAEPAPEIAEPAPEIAEPAPEIAERTPDEPEGTAPVAGDLAIPGYDALSASQVVQRLAGLSSPELEQVRRYEAASRGRKTVLTKISQLQ